VIEQIPAKYRHKTVRGNRLKGWEAVDAGRLARKLKVTSKHLCDVLSGRAMGSMAMLTAIGIELKMSVGVLLARIEQAREITAGSRRAGGDNGKCAKEESRSGAYVPPVIRPAGT
jgi:hypothetical protein